MPSLTQTPSLWDFSLAYYARPGIAETCVNLQDEQGINVNLLLWCLWLGERGLRLRSDEVQAAQQHIAPWDVQYVTPLRQLRRRLKADCGTEDAGINAVRDKIKQAELAAERVLQQQLEHWSGAQRSLGEMHSQTQSYHNLRCYLTLASLSPKAVEATCHRLLEQLHAHE